MFVTAVLVVFVVVASAARVVVAVMMAVVVVMRAVMMIVDEWANALYATRWPDAYIIATATIARPLTIFVLFEFIADVRKT